jgi:choline dehydrogenase
LIDDDTTRGVRYVDRHNELTKVTAECEIVHSAGALATPKLLMLSGVGPADHLRALGIQPVVDLPGVGMNLHDHIELDLQWHCRAPVSSARQLRAHNVLMAGARWLLCKSGPADVGQCHTGAFVRSNEQADRPNFVLMLFPIGFDGWAPRKDIDAFRVTAMLSRPKSRGTLQLRSASPANTPIVDPNYLDERDDAVQLGERYDLLYDLVTQSSFASIVSAPLDPPTLPGRRSEIESLIYTIANPGFHYCGTCRMGAPANPETVVTPR